MSLRTSKVGFLKSGFKSLNSGRINQYCTKARTSDQPTLVFVASEPPKRRSNEILGVDPRFPFSGCIGIDTSRLSVLKKPAKKEQFNFRELSQPTTSDGLLRHNLAELSDILDTHMRIQVAPDYQAESTEKLNVLKAERELELKAVPCPKTLIKEMKGLFVDVDFGKRQKDITVLNLTQKSVNDMSAWSPEMEEEREKLTKDFINVAISICYDLQKLSNGKYWADFIEPASGRPYFGQYTNATLFETDDRYRELGFHIEDLGCCQVIKHVKWATHAFVGTIFTDAPIDSLEVKEILSNGQTGQYFESPKSE